MNSSFSVEDSFTQAGRTRKRHHGRSALIFVGTLMILVLVVSAGVLFPFRRKSYAAGPTPSARLCVEVPNTANCDGHDPIAAGCVQDAITLVSKDAVSQQQKIGRVDKRYSKACDSMWTRVVTYPGTQVAWLNALTQDIVFGKVSSAGNDTRSPDGTMSVYTNMVFVEPIASFGQFPLTNGETVTATIPGNVTG